MRDRKSDAHTKVIPAGPGMIRHHKDEDKANNTPGNLVAVPRGAHTAEHNRSRGLSKLRAALRSFKEGKKVY